MALILLIDDNESLRRTVRRILETAHHTVLDAPDGRVGVNLFRTHQVDIVITDILMPEQEGIETIMELRRLAPAVKIIAISGADAMGRIDFLEAAQQLGADRILRKPVRAAEIVTTVETLLGSAHSTDK